MVPTLDLVLFRRYQIDLRAGFLECLSRFGHFHLFKAVGDKNRYLQALKFSGHIPSFLFVIRARLSDTLRGMMNSCNENATSIESATAEHRCEGRLLMAVARESHILCPRMRQLRAK